MPLGAMEWRTGGDWLTGLAWFLAVLLVLVAATLGWSLRTWVKLRRLGTPLPMKEYLALRWRGVDVAAIAAAHWSARQQGHAVPLDLWVSLAVLRADVVRVAAALGQADQAGVRTVAGVLGAAALAGYDPVEVVQSAHDRGLETLTSTHLTDLDTWGLTRRQDRA